MTKPTPQADTLRLIADDLSKAEPLDETNSRIVKRCSGSILSVALKNKKE